MGGHGEKKLAKHAEETRWYYIYAAFGSALIFVAGRLIWNICLWEVLLFIFFTSVSKFTFSLIDSGLKLGTPHSYQQDVFIVNNVTQVLIVITDYGWLLYLTVPAYVGYYAFGYLWGWLFPVREPGVPETAEERKRREKKERQAEKPKFKTAGRR